MAEVLQLPHCIVDLARCEVRRGAATDALTRLETRLLRYLADRAGEAVARAAVLREVWGYHPESRTHTVAVTVRRLRVKIESDPGHPRVLRTVRGVGWMLDLDPHAEPEDAEAGPEVGLDPFFGRTEELARLTAPSRLTTVLGPPGIGKTRLAREAMQRLMGAGRVEEAWFCDLSSARSPEDLVAALYDTLDLASASTPDLARRVDDLGRYLTTRGDVLLVWDNLEQLRTHAAEPLVRLLRAAPRCLIVATSRARLRVRGERVLSLGPLVAADALALFCDRAAAVVGAFGPEPGEREILADLLAALDHTPLAIELAAARIGLMSVAQIHRGLADRFSLLQRASPGAGRHDTMRATLDWSWGLLSPAERTALTRCTVFAGGFDLEGAMALIDPDDAAERVTSLLDKSLLYRAPLQRASDDLRFDMYQSVRAYTEEQCAPEVAADARDAHLRFFAAGGERARLDAFRGRGGERRLRAARRDVENLRGAVAHGVATGQPDLAALACVAAMNVTRNLGLYALMTRMADDVLACDDLGVRGRVKVLHGQARAWQMLGHTPEAMQASRAAVSLAQGAGLTQDSLGARNGLALLLRQDGDLDGAEALMREVAEAAAAAGFEHEAAIARVNLGNVYLSRSRWEEAALQFQEALESATASGNLSGQAYALASLAIVANQSGRPERALQLYGRGRAIHAELGDRQQEGLALLNMANAHRSAGDLDAARDTGLAAIERMHECGDFISEHVARGDLGALYLLRGDLEPARRELEMAVSLTAEVGFKVVEGLFAAALAEVVARQGDHARAIELSERAETRLRDAGWRGELGVGLTYLAQVRRLGGDEAGAGSLVAEAAAIAEEIGAGPRSVLGQALSRVG